VQRQLPPSLEKQQLTTVGFFWVVTPFVAGAYHQGTLNLWKSKRQQSTACTAFLGKINGGAALSLCHLPKKLPDTWLTKKEL